MEKAKQSSINMSMIDGEINGRCYGDSSDLGIMICRAVYDLLDNDPDMLKPVEKGLRKVIRMKRIDRAVRFFYRWAGVGFAVVFSLGILCLGLTV